MIMRAMLGRRGVLAAIVVLFAQAAAATDGDDAIDRLSRQRRIPARQHGYSDFTDPLGRFLDLLAAGAFADAKALQPDACAAWLATRETSALTGKVWVWDTELNLDVLCARR